MPQHLRKLGDLLDDYSEFPMPGIEMNQPAASKSPIEVRKDFEVLKVHDGLEVLAVCELFEVVLEPEDHSDSELVLCTMPLMSLRPRNPRGLHHTRFDVFKAWLGPTWLPISFSFALIGIR